MFSYIQSLEAICGNGEVAFEQTKQHEPYCCSCTIYAMVKLPEVGGLMQKLEYLIPMHCHGMILKMHAWTTSIYKG